MRTETAGWNKVRDRLLAAALVLRLSLAFFIPWADDGNASYVNAARLALRGDWSSTALLHRLPGAPAAFALALLASGGRDAGIAVLQRLLGLGAFLLIVETAREAWGRRAAACAGLLLLLDWQYPFQECFLTSEPLAYFLLVASLCGAVRLAKRPGQPWWAFAASGLVCALGALTRGELLVLGPSVGAYLAASGARARRPLLAFSAAWLLPIFGWAVRNRLAFGYFGLTPDSVTTATATALPLVDFDHGGQLEAKKILREQRDLSLRFPDRGIDPRSSTIDRLESERRYGYLEAETAVGEIAREAILARPLRYLALTAPNFRNFLKPSRWADFTDAGQMRLPPQSERPLLWLLLRADQAVLWLVLAAAALVGPAFRLRAAGRREAALVLGVFLALWVAVSLMDRSVPRIQAELYLPLALLASFALGELAGKAGSQA